jgi:hypothetical protein
VAEPTKRAVVERAVIFIFESLRVNLFMIFISPKGIVVCCCLLVVRCLWCVPMMMLQMIAGEGLSTALCVSDVFD